MGSVFLYLRTMTAAQVYDLVTGGGAKDFAEVVAILERYRPWCLIGGLAVNCYVEPVYTIDADIVLVVDRLQNASDDLRSAGFRVERFAHSVNAQKPGSKLNIQFTTDPLYQEFLGEAEPREVLGETVPVATLANLVRGKIWAWQDAARRASKRKKDELDLLRIAEAYPEMRGAIPAEIVAQL